MTDPSPAPASRSRRPILLVLGGCAVLALCVLFACSANAIYWALAWRAPRDSSAPAANAEAVRAELESLPEGDVRDGEQVVNGRGGCSGCHSLAPGARLVGPSLSGIASRAATAKPNYSPEMYIYESIVYPKAHVVEGFRGGIMPEGFGDRFTRQELADLVAYLLTVE